MNKRDDKLNRNVGYFRKYKWANLVVGLKKK